MYSLKYVYQVSRILNFNLNVYRESQNIQITSLCIHFLEEWDLFSQLK